MTRIAPRACALNPTLISLAVAACFTAGFASANPTGPQVVNGAATFQNPNASTLAVTNTPGAIINWQGFSIGASEVTRFIQQSSASSVLNRVVSGDVSQIYGQLLSNGRVFLINPGGILVGPGAIVDTAGFVASTLNMVDADFIAGKLKFQGDGDSGSITNQGWIRTGYGGKVVLVAPHIENSGLIHTPGGELILAAGQKLTVSSLDHEGVQFEVQAPTDSVVNLGKLLADGGAVGVFAGTLKHSGDIRANSLVYDQAGQVVLQATNEIQLTAGSTTAADGKTGGSVTVQASGGLDRVAGTVSAQGNAGKGGDIRILGERVALVENAVVNASGATGGGQVLIGGDFQGGNAAVQNSSNTFVGADATVRADATQSGDGGRIIVWSDDKAQFYGTLSAQGGPDGGDGGFAEVSGKQSLVFAGNANLGAPKGKLGSLLLDPIDLFVDAQGGLNPDIIDESTDFPSNAATVSPGTLADIVGNVTLYAARYMRINSAIDLTQTSGATPTATPAKGLTAQVGTWPDTTTPLTATDPLNMSVGTVLNQLDIGANITTANGAVSLSAPRIQTFATSIIATAGGAINISATGAIQASSLTLDAGTGAITATANAGSLQLSGVTSSGSLSLTSTGGSIFANDLTSTGPVTLASSGGYISVGNIVAGAATSLTSSSQIYTDSISTNGGALTATANDGQFYAGDTIDTRPGQAGASGGAITITAKDTYSYYGYGYVNTRGINAGNANVSLTGETITTNSQAIDTTGSVTLTSSHSDQYANASINTKINNAASVTATAENKDTSSNGGYSASINISSDTTLNANSISATTTSCYTYYGYCGGANITLSGNLGVNVGTVTATAPVNFSSTSSSSGISSTYADSRYESISKSVNISSSAGPILATGASSLVTAADVTLSTIPSGNTPTGGDIGSTTLPLKVSAERNFTLKSGGDFKVDLVGAGPNRLDVQLGVAPTGLTWSGSLTGTGSNGVTLAASATESTVTVSNFSLTGFDQLVYGQSPNVSLNVPNGNLTANTVSMPKGDNTGSYSPYYQSLGCSRNGPASCTYTNPYYPYGPVTISPRFESLSVNLRASGNLQVDSYTRAGTSADLAQGTTFRSDDGSVTLGTVSGNRDGILVFADTGISLTGSMTTSGSVSLTNSVSGNIAIGDGSGDLLTADGGVTISNSGSGTSDVSVVGIVTTGGSGSVTITANGTTSKVGAAVDGSALEITSGGSVTITAKTIGNENFTNPLDIAANSISLTTSGSDAGILGDIGFTAKPVVANTQNLTISAGANFNVDTGSTIPLKNLTVTASPAAVGAGGLAQVNSESQTYAFQSDGTNFTLGPWTTPSTQFISGTLAFTSTAGNVLLGNMNLAQGSLAVTATTGDVTLGNMNLALGNLSVTATKGSITAGTLDGKGIALVAEPSTLYYAPVRDSVGVTTGNIGSGVRPDSLTITAGNYYRPGRVQTGDIEAGNINVSAYRGADSSSVTSLPTEAILVGNIGTITRAGTVSLATQYSYWGDAKNIVAGNIRADSVNLQSYYYAYYTNPTIATGNLDATTSIALSTKSAVSVGSVSVPGTIDAPSVSITGTYYGSPTILAGTIGATRPAKTLNISGTTVNLGAITGDPSQADSLNVSGSTVTLGGGVGAGAASNVNLYSGSGLLTLGGDVTTGDGSTINLTSGGAGRFMFTNLSAGANGAVTVTSSNGIRQTGATGITAKTARLYASAGSIDRGDTSVGGQALDLLGVSDLTVDAGVSATIDLHSTVLTDLNITKRSAPDSGSLSLSQMGTGQSLAISGSGTTHTLEASSTPALNFTANFPTAGHGVQLVNGGIATGGGFATLSAAGPIDASVVGAGIATSGGAVTLTSSGTTASIDTGAGIVTGGGTVAMTSYGPVATGVINTSGTGGTGGNISINTYNSTTGSISVGGDLTSSAGSIALNANYGGNVVRSATRIGGWQVSSDTSVSVYAGNGDIGTSGTKLLIDSPVVTLDARGLPAAASAGNAFADLTRTATLSLQADDGFNVSSATTLGTLTLKTRGFGTGTPANSNLNLTALDQSYSFARPTTDLFGTAIINTFEVVSAGGTTPPTNLTIQATDGDLLVRGPGTISATNLTLWASTAGDIKLQGSTASPLTLSNTTQKIGYDSYLGTVRDVLITGNVALSATDQKILAYRNVTAQAQSGSVALSATDQRIEAATGTIALLGGSAADEKITVSATSTQAIRTFQSYGGQDIQLQAGTGDRSSVTVSYTGTGTQTIEANRDVLLSGGTNAAGTGALVTITTGGTATQTVRADRNVNLAGGAGTGAVARIEHTGTGTQRVGETRCYYYCEPYRTNAITLQGGTGTDAAAEIVAAGAQRIYTENGTLNVLGGQGAGAYAQIKSTATTGPNGEFAQAIGFPNYYPYYYGFDGGYGGSAHSSVNIVAGSGTGAYARVAAAGPQALTANSAILVKGNGTNAYASLTAPSQEIRYGAVTVEAGAADGSNALIQATGTQYFDVNGLAVKGGGGAGATATAQVLSGDTQYFDYAGTVTMLGGTGTASFAKISAPKAQTMYFGSINMTAGAGTGSSATIYTDETQYLSGGNVTLSGSAGTDSIARIYTPKDQTLYFGSINMTAGTTSGSYVKIDSALKQYLSGSNITLTAGGVGETTVANAKAIIEGQEQEIYASSITLKGGSGTAGNTADALLRNLAGGTTGNQIVRANGTLTLQGGHQNSTTGIVNQGSGTQSVTGRSGITLVSDTVTPPAHADSSVVIQNSTATAQTLSAQFGGISLDNKGDGIVEITSGGNQSADSRYVDVITSAGSTGNAKLAATGNQWIRTTSENTSPDASRPFDPGPLPDYGLRVAAFGTGTASIESGANQLLEITYPQMMQTTGLAAGLIVGGTQQSGVAPRLEVAGTSRIKATVNQTIFAGTIWVETGLNASAPTQKFSEIKAGTDQVITTLNGGIMILGGVGNDTVAQIDPVNQTIVVNGTLNVIGGTGTNAVAQVVAGSGGVLGQTILATNGDILLDGGSGVGANALITSGGLQTVGASGTITLTPGVTPTGGPGGAAGISPLGSVPAGCAAPCILTTVASSGGSSIAETFATNPVVDQFDELIELTGTTLVAEDTTILTRRAPICR